MKSMRLQPLRFRFLDGVWLKVRRAFGPQRVLLLVAYGVRTDGRRQLLAFVRAKSESQAGWEGLLNDLYRRGLRGQRLQLVITDGCPGLAAAIPSVYPSEEDLRNHRPHISRGNGESKDRYDLGFVLPNGNLAK
jgi:transposase-like protein